MKKDNPIIAYDQATGVIRMIDTSVEVSGTLNVSPIKLTYSLRQKIKKEKENKQDDV